MVTHSRDNNARHHASQPESFIKPLIEVSTMDGKRAAKYHRQENEVTLPGSTMSENGMWPYQPDGSFPSLCDGDPTKELENIAVDSTEMSNNSFGSKSSNSIASLGELCPDDPILSSRSTAVHSNSYNYPLHVSEAENHLSFIDSLEIEPSGLVYYSMDDMGFEDVFRNCDSSLDLQNTCNDDPLDWLSISNAIEESEAATRTDFVPTGTCSSKKLPEDLEPIKLYNERSSANDSNVRSMPYRDKTSLQLMNIEDTASPSCISIVNGSNETAESRGDTFLKDQQRKTGEGKNDEQNVEKVVSLYQVNDLRKDSKYLSPVDTTICVQQHKPNQGPDSFDYLYANVPYVQSDCHQPSDQTTISSTLAATKMENTTVSQKGSSLSFEGSQNKDYCQDLSSMEIDVALEDKFCHPQGHQASFNVNTKSENLSSLCTPFSVQSGNEFGNYSDIEGVSLENPAKVGPWYVQEGPSINSEFDEGSLEATSFHQLQQVMEQLDIRTKLCIRDSLYRLARSAEQRHNNGGSGGDRDNKTFMGDGTNKSGGFADIETNTNPIDRSVAHLLFHRPSPPLQSQSIIPGSTAEPPMTVKKLDNNESAAETDPTLANL